MLSRVSKLKKILAQKSVVPPTSSKSPQHVPIYPNNNVIAKIDSGVSKDYFRECNVAALKSVKAIDWKSVV